MIKVSLSSSEVFHPFLFWLPQIMSAFLS